jgi:hypothetical protein
MTSKPPPNTESPPYPLEKSDSPSAIPNPETQNSTAPRLSDEPPSSSSIDEKAAAVDAARYEGENHAHKVSDREVLDRINTSQEGVEYPTGVKLGLVTLALCLSVFCMVCRCVAMFGSH